MARFLCFLGHPGHFHLFKHVVEDLLEDGHEVRILLKTKDVLVDLVKARGWEYENVLPHRRGWGLPGLAWRMLLKDLRILAAARRFRPHVLAGTSAEITHVGRLLGIPSVVVNEDDHDVVPWLVRLSYPFADAILAPSCCSVGRWEHKRIPYRGYHELAYLHPDYFQPDPAVGEQLRDGADGYFILRFADLNAHHDAGRHGLSGSVARRLVERLLRNGRVYISAERPLEAEFEPYRLSLPAERMHDALAAATLYVGDSQTMAAEAAVLGTPSVRFNDFVGQIGYLEELEHTWGLTVGVPRSQPDRLLRVVDRLLARPDLPVEWQRRRRAMLDGTIDVADLLCRVLEETAVSGAPPLAAMRTKREAPGFRECVSSGAPTVLLAQDRDGRNRGRK